MNIFSVSFPCSTNWFTLASAATLCFSSLAGADEVADAVKLLETAVQTETAQKKPVADGEAVNRYGERGMGPLVFAQLRAAISRGEPQQIEEVLNQLPAYFSSEPVQQAVRQVRETFRVQREAKEQAFVKSIREALENAGKAVKSATKPADLDNALSALANFREQPEYRASETARMEANKVQTARQFVIYWQDYLASQGSGDTKTALQKLENASGSNVPDLLPRSEILARIEQLKSAKSGKTDLTKIREIVDGTKTLDDIAATVSTLAASFSEGSNYREPVRDVLNELRTLGRLYNEFQAGLPARIEIVFNNSNQGNELFRRPLALRAELMRLIIARQLRLEGKLKPTADEPITDYFHRILTDAKERCDARMILRVIDVQKGLNIRLAFDSSNTLQALLGAQNQEEAGQFVPAVISYQNALKNGGELVSAKAIGARLDAIKAAQPAEFEKAMQLFMGSAPRVP